MVGKKSAGVVDLALPEDTALASLLSRSREVVAAHERVWGRQLRDAGVDVVHGRASFVGPHELRVQTVKRQRFSVQATSIVIATGSRPRTPPDVPVDHSVILDSDSVLALPWLPRRMVVLGAGVIATEYAAIFACLGVDVVMVDKAPRPLGFLDGEIVGRFLSAFERADGRFLGGRGLRDVQQAFGAALVTLDDDVVLEADKVLCCLGRVVNVEHLKLDAVGLTTDARGLLVVDDHQRTAVPHVLAVGDVIGPPSLASTSLEQGRRAGRVACGQTLPSASAVVPVGVYAVPELASVGLDEEEAARRGIDVVVGRAEFGDTARGVIAASEGGLLKLVCSADQRRVLGVQVIGEGAAELVHLGQLAMLGGLPPAVFVEQAFNFPTMAEAYRVAARDIMARAKERVPHAHPSLTAEAQLAV